MIETPIHKNIREELEARRKGLAQEQASPTADTANTLVYSKEDINARTTFARMLSLGSGTGNPSYTALYGGTFFTNALGPDPLGTKDRLDPTLSYNFDENKGLTAQPGITQVQSEYMGEGAVMATKKKTTINFTCFSLTDLTILMHEFMIPGTEVLVDFGWVNPKRANEISEGSFIELLNSGITLKEGTNFFDYFQSFDKIFASYGNIETCIGRVTEYGFNVTDDGSFECTISLISSGVSFYTNDIATDEHPVAFVAQTAEAQEEFKKLKADATEEEKKKLAPDVVPVDLINYIATMRSQIIGTCGLAKFMPRAYATNDNPHAKKMVPAMFGTSVQYQNNTAYSSFSSGKQAFNFNNSMCFIMGMSSAGNHGGRAFPNFEEDYGKGYDTLEELFFGKKGDRNNSICGKLPNWIGYVETSEEASLFSGNQTKSHYGFLLDENRDFLFVFTPFPKYWQEGLGDKAFLKKPYYVHIFVRMGYFEDNVLTKFSGVTQDDGDTYSFRSVTPVPTDTIKEDLKDVKSKEEYMKVPIDELKEAKDEVGKMYKFMNEPTRMVVSQYPYPKDFSKILVAPAGGFNDPFGQLLGISSQLDEEGEAGKLCNVKTNKFYRSLYNFLGGGTGDIVKAGDKVSAMSEFKIDKDEKGRAYSGAKQFFVDPSRPTEGGYLRNMYINLDVIQESFCGATNREFFYRPNHHQTPPAIEGAPDFNRSAAVGTIDEGIKNLLDFIQDQFNNFNSFKIQSNPVYPNISGIVDTNYTNPGDDIFTVKAFKKDSLTTNLSFDYSIPPNVQKAAIFGAGLSGQDSLAFGSFPKGEQKDLIAIMEFKETLKSALNKKEDNLVSSKSMPFTKFPTFGSTEMTLDEKKKLITALNGKSHPVAEYVKNHINVIEPFQLQKTGKSNFKSELMGPQVMYSALLKDSDLPESEKKVSNTASALTSITLADFQDALETKEDEKDLVSTTAPQPFIPSKLIELLSKSPFQDETKLTQQEEDIASEAKKTIINIKKREKNRFRFFTYEKTTHDNLQHNLPVMKMSSNLQQMYEHLHLTNQLQGKRNPHYALPGMLKVSITLHGIAGILPGNKFKVDYLPKSLEETTYFLCTGVTQDLTADGWTTTIEALLRKDPRKASTTPITYTLNVNNIYEGQTVDVGPPPKRPDIPIPPDEEPFDFTDLEMEPLDLTDDFDSFMTPYSVEFDTEHQFKRPLEPVAPGTIADGSQTAYYNIKIDPYNPLDGVSTSYGFGQTDIITQEEFDALVSYYSNVEEYKEHVDIDEFGNELDAKSQIELWLDERYETFTITDMNIGTNIGASDEFARNGESEENAYDKFGMMTVYVRKDPPGASTINSTMQKILKIAEDLRKYNERENQLRADFASDDPLMTINIEDTNREYLDDALRLFLSKDRNILNLIHPAVINTPVRKIEFPPSQDEDIVEVDETKLNAETDLLNQEFDELINEEIILPKPEVKITNVKLTRDFSLEWYLARGRIGPIGVWYWEPGAYLQFLDGSGNPLTDISTERRIEETERFLRTNVMVPRPGWYYTAVAGLGLPGSSSDDAYINGINRNEGNIVLMTGQNPSERGTRWNSSFERKSVPVNTGAHRARVPMADVNGKGMTAGRGPAQWIRNRNVLQAMINRQIELMTRNSGYNGKLRVYRNLGDKELDIFTGSPYFKYTSSIATMTDPGRVPFYQESIDAAAVMGNVISRADFATKNKMLKFPR